ncbi:hypothetical protein C8R44DRAFT_640551 [Mycena epipterygia]|nr:hypothetical protein C8R44DRAFT_640551 [Mycena epipterygia]
MPAISSGKVLITGTNGYITWVIRTLLEQGFSVQGAVCSADKIMHLCELFASYSDKLKFIIVPNITQVHIVGVMEAEMLTVSCRGVFDEAVKGVNAIEHMASPYHFHADNLTVKLLEPTINGTVHILESAHKYGMHNTLVKHIVVTSSMAAVMKVSEEPLLLSELNWNNQAMDDVKKNGCSVSGAAKYHMPKMLAERGVWADFMKTHKGEITWDLAVMKLLLTRGAYDLDLSQCSHDLPTP